MKTWSLIRKTLKSLGFTSETAEGITVESIESDATVNYKIGDVEISGNIATPIDIGIDLEDTIDQDSGTTGTIIFAEGTSITLASGETHQIVLTNEDGATIDLNDISFTSTNHTHVTVDADGEITAEAVGSATVKAVLDANTDVFTKIKVIVE